MLGCKAVIDRNDGKAAAQGQASAQGVVGVQVAENEGSAMQEDHDRPIRSGRGPIDTQS